MQRRMFLSFGATILLTLVAVVGVMRLVVREGPPVCKAETQIRRFHQISFERVWDRPEERTWMAEQWHQEFGADLKLLDANGAVLSHHGTSGCQVPKMVVDLGPPGHPRGQVILCDVEDPFAARKAQHLGLALLVAGCTV